MSPGVFGQQVSGSTSRSRHISPMLKCLLWPSFYAPGHDVQSYERFHALRPARPLLTALIEPLTARGLRLT
ncbi:MAG: hypothetical protein KDB01_11865 [Planctomycetaceae bacterium]|nr:hypothetical protein [Planctomycetaceae bacterium]